MDQQRDLIERARAVGGELDADAGTDADGGAVSGDDGGGDVEE